MQLGRRLIFIVFAGLGLGAAQPPNHIGEQPANATYEEIERSLEKIAAAINNQNEAPEHGQPCKEGNEDRSSDLCAQWKAADAAHNSVKAAWIVGGIGTLIGALTLGAAVAAARYAKRAADHTREANKIARDIGEAQVRCYLSVKNVKLRFDALGLPMISMVGMNSGQSPARNFAWTFSAKVSNIQDGWEWVLEPGAVHRNRDIAAQGEEFFALTIANGQPLPQVNLADLLLGPNLRIKVKIIANWKDVFETEDGHTWPFEAMIPGVVEQDMALYPDVAPDA